MPDESQSHALSKAVVAYEDRLGEAPIDAIGRASEPGLA